MLSTDFSDPDARPYFLWSESFTVRDLREILAGGRGEYLQEVYLGRFKWEHFRVPDLPDEVVRETVRFFQEWMGELALDLHPGP